MSRYLLFYKPYGVLSQFTPEPGSDKPTLKTFIDIPDIYAAGRLDHDSEGLMLLTDDGVMQHRLTDPRHHHPRTYWAQVERIPDDAAIEQLRIGVKLQDGITRPAKVRLLDAEPDLPPRDPPIRVRKSVPDAWIELTLTEGRNRQVRRMTAAVGHPTLRLVRAAIGPLSLKGLKPGESRKLTKTEMSLLKQTPVKSKPA